MLSHHLDIDNPNGSRRGAKRRITRPERWTIASLIALNALIVGFALHGEIRGSAPEMTEVIDTGTVQNEIG